jgi:hypothetical protein
MAIDLNKQIGPFPLKLWLIIGAGGIGVGLLVSRKMGASDTSGTIAQPGTVNFVRIGAEHVPNTLAPVAALVPTPVNPIMPSNPAATPLRDIEKPAIVEPPIIGVPWGIPAIELRQDTTRISGGSSLHNTLNNTPSMYRGV